MELYIHPHFKKYFQKSPIVLVDVGASGGLQKHWSRAKEHLYTIGFEPDPREYAVLKEQNIHPGTIYINAALNGDSGLLDFNLTRKQECSSVFVPNRDLIDRFPESERYDILQTQQMEANTLDHLLEMHQLPDVDFIKIDTQGNDLSIISGAWQTIERGVFGLEIEVEFAPIYCDQPLFSDVDPIIRELGFELFDIKPYYWKRKTGIHYGKPKGQLIFGDALYFRSANRFRDAVLNSDDEYWQKTKVLRAISICAVYGYFDYARELFDSFCDIFDKPETDIFYDAIQQTVARSHRTPEFRGRTKLLRFLKKAIRYLDRKKPSGWAFSGRLGNR